MKPLSELSSGEFGYIVDLLDRRTTLELFEQGCFPGDLIRVVDNLPQQDFISFRCRRNLIHLYKARAQNVMTHPTSFHFCLN